MNNKMEDCIFCKIIKGKISSIKIYEDEYAVAIMTLQPNTEGHALIIPKEHHTNILEEKTETGEKLLKIIQKIGKAQKEGLGAEGVNIIINTGEAAGQAIMHTHIHLIPRYKNDGLKHWPEKKISEEEKVIIAEKIMKEL